MTQTGLTPVMWAASPCADPRALVNPQGGQAGAGWSGSGTIAISLQSPTDTAVHTLHVYCVDWNRANCIMQVNAQSTVPSAPATSKTPAVYPLLIKKPVQLLNFGEGTWLYFRFRGNITLIVQGNNKSTPVVSALMFD